jgi:putative tryptophan/tyrosine transport system substrate-binding protein
MTHITDGRGGLMSYGPYLRGSFQPAAFYGVEILRDTKPADLPFERPTELELVLSLSAGRQSSGFPTRTAGPCQRGH